MVFMKEETNSDMIIKGPPFPLKQDVSLGRFLMTKFNKYGENIAQIYSPTGETQTFNEIKRKVIRLAIGLREYNIGQGDVISLCTTNIPDSSLPVFAGLINASLIAPLDPSLSKMDIKHLMNISEPKIIFCEPSSVVLIAEVIQELGLNTEIIVFGQSNKYTQFSQLLKPENECNWNEFESVDFTNPQDHIAFLMSSSGTTGLPKCVALTHANVLTQLQLYEHLKMENMRILNMSSLFWISGVLVSLGTVCSGAVRILTPPFEPEQSLRDIQQYKAFWILVGVTYFARLVSEADSKPEYDLSSVKILSVNGGRASDYHINLAAKIFPFCQLSPGYGMTELTGNAFQLTAAKDSSIGYLLPGMQAKIIDLENGKSLGPNQPGELVLKGPIMFKGYYRNQKATDETIDTDGWLHTGDLGLYDEDNCFFIEGRIKEQFKVRGWQISPLEMESVLVEHPEIKEAAVLGVPHKVDVNRAKAFIVKRQNSQITEDDVHDYMQERMNKHKQITGGIHFVESLPVTPTGKIQRRTLIELSKQYTSEE